MSNNAPVGIFDSGVGGLSVAVEIQHALPHEDLLYVADSGHAPYGDKPRDYIDARATAILSFLIEQGAKAVVVACNTATAVSVDLLRATFQIPIVAIEPAVKPAAAATRTGVVGVLATTQTIASTRFERLTEHFARDVEILAQPCPGLVERVEAGALDGAETRALVETYVRPLVERGADTLVLGCTHYPFLRPLIESVAGAGVGIIDPAAAVARELRRRLTDGGLLTAGTSTGTLRVWTTGLPEQVRHVLDALAIPHGEVSRL